MAKRERGGSGLLVKLARSSRILTGLDRFTVRIYDLLKNGFFGWIFSNYREAPRSRLFSGIGQGKAASHLRELRFGICRRMETSLIVRAVSYLMRALLGCRLKVWGTFFFTFAAYSLAQLTVVSVLKGKSLDAVFGENSASFVSYAAALASIPLILSKKTLAEALADSAVGRTALKIGGFRPEDLRTEGDGGHLNVAFLLGIFLGTLTYWIPSPLLLLGLAGIAAACLILIKPEIGVLALFFSMPWLPTMVLAALVIYTSLCLFLKLFRRKRIFRLEPVDIMAGAFAVLTFFGGTVSLSSASLKPALLMVCFMAGYFLTVTLITSREWLVRCSSAAVLSASLIGLYGIYQYFTHSGYSSDAWLDSEMFGGIAGRAVATLENPNMLGEYLILVIPIAVSMFIGRGEGFGRIQSVFCIGIMGACLLLTWSRGAWLGLIAAALVFLFMWHRRSVWLVLAGIAALPALPAFLPQSVLGRFASIGDMADSSTSYRVYIWRASVGMIRDNLLSGIGIGEGAWFRLYPRYAYQGIEAAPHSHNLYMQIWLELGIVGIAVFLVFLFLLFQSAFTLFRELSGSRPLRNPDLSASLLESRLKDPEEAGKGDMRRGKTQLRISAAGPLCGIVAVLVQGMTDYAWYNYRLFLMFWLTAALAACYIRNGRSELETPYFESSPTSSEKVLPLLARGKKTKKEKRAENDGQSKENGKK